MTKSAAARPFWGNDYNRQYSPADVARRAYRRCGDDLWQRIGRLQFEFLVSRGLLPQHRLLDVGCGPLRGGVHFVRYLEPEHYYGIDINASLIQAAHDVELVEAGLVHQRPNLLVDDSFNFARFGASFDFALAQSVFTHLPVNSILRCLANMARVLQPGGRFYATFFEAPTQHHLEPLHHEPGGKVTHFDRDPFHYHPSAFESMVAGLPLSVRNLGDWQHPRAQHMLEIVRT
jgi:SAM-dependent methyltransferase